MKQGIHTLLLFILLGHLPEAAHAQFCSLYPADCPHEDNIKTTMDRDIAITNKVLPQEMDMMARARTFLTDYLTQLTGQQHWQLYEFNEDYAIANCARYGAPYPVRAPFSCNISFLLIVNSDTMATWKKWRAGFDEKVLQQTNTAVASLHNNAPGNDAGTKQYADSAEYYGNLKSRYMEQHAKQYENDLRNNNQAGIKTFQEATDRYDKIINGFTTRAYSNTNNNLLQLENQVDQNQWEERRQTRRFRDAATLLIHVSINTPVQSTGIVSPATQKYLLPQKKWTLPGTSFAGLVHNTSPEEKIRLRSDSDNDMDYIYPTDEAILLFGSWLPLNAAYNTYNAGFSASKQSNDCVSVKKIPCDKIQTMAVLIEGKESNINRLMQLMQTEKLNELIDK